MEVIGKDEANDGFPALHSARRAVRQKGVRQEVQTQRAKSQEPRAAAVSHVRQRDEGMKRTFQEQVNHVERAFLRQMNHEMHMATLLDENSTAKSGASEDVLKSRDDMGNGVDAAVRGAGAAGLAISRVAAWDSAHGGNNLATHGTINLATPPQSPHQKGLLDNKRGLDNGVNSTVMEEAATKLENTLVDKELESAAAIRPTYGLLRPLSGAAAMHMPHTELVRKKKPHLSLPQALPEAHLHQLHHLEHSGKHVQHGPSSQPSSLLTLSRSVLQPNDEGANLPNDQGPSPGRNSHFQ